MIWLHRITSLSSFCVVLFVAQNSQAMPTFKKSAQPSVPAVLKADSIDGDNDTKILTATGNVEVAKGSSVVYADKMTYDKNGKIIRAIGNVKIKDIEIGNVRATEAKIKDDFSSGTFSNSKMVFTDGSYLSSPKITRENPNVTVLEKPIFSICPNPDISADNNLAGKKRDMASIKSSTTTLDRESGIMKSRNGIFRIYDVPIFYTPYLRVTLPTKGRKSGFLTPTYTKTTNFGLGLKIPYYFNIAPNMELTTTTHLNANGQILLLNEFHHLANYGEYKTNLEVANNKVTNTNNSTVVQRTNQPYRWNISGEGKFDFTNNFGLDFVGNILSDRNYARDYHFNYIAYTMSKLNVDYIKGRDYYAAKAIKFQELENITSPQSAQLVVPSLDYHVESKPLSNKEKFAFTSNVTTINRYSGLQYRRATMVPEAQIPFNLHGNLFTVDAKAQTDFYSLENNFQHGVTATNDYSSTQTNYKPEASFNWRLPLIRKAKANTLMIEPMANFVMSSYHKNFSKLPNEDSNDSELTVSNLFVADRIAGFDRNEAGTRVNYGVKSSLFNKYGEFGLTIGQGYKKSNSTQDVVIRGFADNNKSNIVGQAMYKAAKYFTFAYSFQLNESSYSNDVNQISAALNFERFTFSTDYLFLRVTSQNPLEREQLSFSSIIKLNNMWKATVAANKDLVANRVISRGITLSRDGCCTVLSIAVVESNPSTLIKPQKTFNFSISFKNL